MRKLICMVVVTWLSLSWAGPVQAQDLRPYAGVGLGVFRFDLNPLPIKSVFGGYAQLGVDLGEYVGAELRVGSTSTGHTASLMVPTIKVRLVYFVSYLAKLQYPVTPDFRIFALVGGSTARASASGGYDGAISDTTTSGSFGGGVDYRVTDHFAIGAEFLRYASDTDGFVATIKYLF